MLCYINRVWQDQRKEVEMNKTLVAALVLLSTSAFAQPARFPGEYQQFQFDPQLQPESGIQDPYYNTNTIRPEDQIERVPNIGPNYLQGPCISDYMKFCGSEGGGAATTVGCLRQQWTDISPACRNAITQYKSAQSSAQNLTAPINAPPVPATPNELLQQMVPLENK